MVSARWSTPEGFGRERSPLLTANTVARRNGRKSTSRRNGNATRSSDFAPVGHEGDAAHCAGVRCRTLSLGLAAMATQSLYRRYRPRRFSELKGQDHVVKALRDSVREGREGQAYLFSGPRGTGKTTTARILAKVLNCENVVDGEPCCECESCLAVERGTSYDVHELDAASNNGVDSIRELIERAVARHRRAATRCTSSTRSTCCPRRRCRRAAQDARGAAAARRVRARHHRSAEGDRHDPVAHAAPPVPPAPRRHDGRARALGRRRRRARPAPGGARRRPRPGRRVGPRHAVGARAADLDRRRRRRRGRPRRVHARPDRTRSRPRTHRDGARRLARARPAGGHRGARAPPAQRVPVADGARAGDPAVRPGRHDRACAPASWAPRCWCGRSRLLGTTMVEMRLSPDPRILAEVALVQLTNDEAGTDVDALLARIERLENTVKQLREERPQGLAAVRQSEGSGDRTGGARRCRARQPAGGAHRQAADAPPWQLPHLVAAHAECPVDGARGVGADRQGPGQADHPGAVLGRIVRRQQRRGVAVQRPQRGPWRQVPRAPCRGRGRTGEGRRRAGEGRVRGRRAGPRRRAGARRPHHARPSRPTIRRSRRSTCPSSPTPRPSRSARRSTASPRRSPVPSS